MSEPLHVTVAGAGAWGTALAIQAARAGCAVTLVARTAQSAAALAASRTSRYLPDLPLPAGIAVADSLPTQPGIVLWAVPMQQLRASLLHFQPTGVPVVLCCKGVEQTTNLLPLEVLAAVAPDCLGGILSGPNFAHEIAAGLPAASVIASTDAPLRARIADQIGGGAFRIYGNDDPVGVQIGGAAKNVIAIAAGAVTGAGLGENARAALITRGLAELRRLVEVVGGRPETVTGLSGLGDLLLTCTGKASRNFSLGFALGQGHSLQETLAASHGVVEGVATAAALLARAGAVELPVCQAVAAILSGRLTLETAMRQLLARPRRDE